MKAVIFKTPNAVFEFDQKEVNDQIVLKKSAYDTDEVNKLLNLISPGNQETIVIPAEPVFFDSIAVDLIGAGNGLAICKICNKTYLAGQFKSIKVGSGGSPLDIQREKKSVFSRLCSKRCKPPTMHGGRGYECPEGHNLLTVITWKTF
jgi:hypothetical protein